MGLVGLLNCFSMQIFKMQPEYICLVLLGDSTQPANSINSFNLWVKKELSIFSVSAGYDSDGKGNVRFHIAMVLPERLPADYFVRSWELFAGERGLSVAKGYEQYISYRKVWIDGIDAVKEGY